MAKERGITREEIGAVQAVVMAVSAGRINAQFREARIQSRKNKKKRKADESGC